MVLRNNQYRTLILSKYIGKILTWINKARIGSIEREAYDILLKTWIVLFLKEINLKCVRTLK